MNVRGEEISGFSPHYYLLFHYAGRLAGPGTAFGFDMNWRGGGEGGKEGREGGKSPLDTSLQFTYKYTCRL
jgi:hypothetical protein